MCHTLENHWNKEYRWIVLPHVLYLFVLLLFTLSNYNYDWSRFPLLIGGTWIVDDSSFAFNFHTFYAKSRLAARKPLSQSTDRTKRPRHDRSTS